MLLFPTLYIRNIYICKSIVNQNAPHWCYTYGTFEQSAGAHIVYAGACAHPCWIAFSLNAIEGWRCWCPASEGAQEVYVYASMDYVFFFLCREWTQRCRHWPAQLGDHTPSHYQTDNRPGEFSDTHLTHTKLFKAHGAMQDLNGTTASCWWIMVWHIFLRLFLRQCFCMFSAGQACSVRHYS